MSTISKIDPTVRRQRTERRNTTRALAALLPHMEPHKRLAATVVVQSLELIRRDSSLTGAEKQHLFTTAAKLEFTNDSPVTDRGA